MSTLGSVTTTRSYDTSNRLNSLQSNTLGTTNISYDIQGNVSQRGAQAFIFDQANRLQSATNKATYRYDGLGRRSVINAADGSTSVQLYSSAGQILYSTITGGSSGAGSATRYVYLGQRLIAETKIANGASSTRYIHTDGLGSPVAHTDSAGSVVDRSRYEAYGANVNTAGSTNPVGIGFTGHVNDVDTGLIYMQQRYYDPIAGRFLSTDQVLTDTASGAMFNRYVYTSNNPYRYTDPDGRQFTFCGSYRCETYTSESGSSSPRGNDGATVAGGIVGGLIGGAVAGGCDFFTAGACVLANPWMVGGGAALGAAGGVLIVDSVNKLVAQASGAVDKLFSKPPSDAKDPNGSKAPGKPGEAEGFKDPKGGEKWVPNPNPRSGVGTHGWLDDKGKVWVPTGQGGNAHGGPHWDVQTPGGGYENIRPVR